MARRTTFGKMQRDRDKKAKAAAKIERRRERLSGDADEPVEPEPAPTGPQLSQAEVIERLETLHARFEDGQVSFDDFEEQKAALLARLADAVS